MCLVVLCIVIFAYVSDYLKKNSDDTINSLGTLYMSEMSLQLQQKFDAIVNLRIMQVERRTVILRNNNCSHVC